MTENSTPEEELEVLRLIRIMEEAQALSVALYERRRFDTSPKEHPDE
jgi:hypothetical protein